MYTHLFFTLRRQYKDEAQVNHFYVLAQLVLASSQSPLAPIATANQH